MERRRNSPKEHYEQAAFMSRVQWLRPALVEFVAAVPNGGARDKRTSGMLKAEGVRRGFPDVVVVLARGGAFGLLIEFKRQGVKRARDDQDALHRLYRAQGYRVAVCSGCNDAWELFTRYVDDEPTAAHERTADEGVKTRPHAAMGNACGDPFDV